MRSNLLAVRVFSARLLPVVPAGGRAGLLRASAHTHRFRATLGLTAAAAFAAKLCGSSITHGAGDDGPEAVKKKVLSALGINGGNEEEDEVERFIDAYGGYIGKFGFGGFMGFSSGYALKKVGKLAAVVIGIGFVGLQGLAYGGYIKQIDWKKVEEKAVKMVDVDGSGSFDKEDVKAWWRQLKKVLKQQMPTNSGFAGGFALGFYTG